MTVSKSAVGTAAFFVVAPGTVLGVIPWLITRWEWPDFGPAGRVAQAFGVLLIVAGLVPLVHAFTQFAKAGGVPVPVAPTKRLVVTGSHRFVRNPMYVALVVVILGQALLFGSVDLVVYAAIVWIVTAAFVRWYEEPTLARQFGSEYEAYRSNVRAWIPRIHPWTPALDHSR
jgi:protein-S-isoprenylcysteine O-methyltransferase Ste14